MSEFNQARREGKIKFGYDFDSLAEVTHLWGLKATKLPYSIRFRIPGKDNAICCMLVADGGNGWKNVPHYGTRTDSRGWNEILRIDESNTDEEVSKKRVQDELENTRERYVFWRESRDGAMWYKFQGVFEIDRDTTNALVKEGRYICVYRRKSAVGECPKCEEKCLSPEDVNGLKGVVVEVNLLDKIDYELQSEEKKGEVKVWPGQKFWVENVTGTHVLGRTANGAVLSEVPKGGDVVFSIPRRDFELGYFKVLDEGGIEDTKGDSEDDPLPEKDEISPEEFERFWSEFTGWWKVSDEEEELTIKRGKDKFILRCSWNEGMVIVAMVSPWPMEWDYVEMYRGMFGWGEVGSGFCKKSQRKKVANLLLDEIIKRKKWLQENPGAVAERDKALKEHPCLEGDDKTPTPEWFAKYRWTRNRTRSIGEGDNRLYVEGCNVIWSMPLHCEWALRDMG